MDAEIRTLVFNQGVGVALPPSAVDVSNNTVLANNATTSITQIAYALSFARAIIITYFIYRRTDSGYKSQSGQIMFEGQNDAALAADKWKVSELVKVERGGDGGITFGSSVVASETNELTVTLDNMAGANGSHIMYWKISTLLT